MEPELTTDPKLNDILEELKKREPIFHHEKVGATRADFEKMMDENFWEVGASGKRYSRDFCIDVLVERYSKSHEDIWKTQDFHCLEIAPNNYLLTYTLFQGKENRKTRRMTIWRRAGDEWKILYHQGTVAQES